MAGLVGSREVLDICALLQRRRSATPWITLARAPKARPKPTTPGQPPACQAAVPAAEQAFADCDVLLAIGTRFGADEQFGILLGASYSDRTYSS